jgi:hypothetical protein
MTPNDPQNDNARALPEVREAHDAAVHKKLRRNPEDEDAKLDIALDETFPTSDAPSITQPGKSKEPPASSGYDEEMEAELARRAKRAKRQ